MAIPKKSVAERRTVRHYVDKVLERIARIEEFSRKIPNLPKKDLLKLTGKFAGGITLVCCVIMYTVKGGIGDYFETQRRLREARVLELHGIKPLTKHNPGTDRPFESYGWDFRDIDQRKKSESEPK